MSAKARIGKVLKSRVRMDYFLSVLGLVLIIEGIPYFAFPEKMREMLAKIPLVPAASLRIFGITAVILGLLCIFAAKRLLQA